MAESAATRTICAWSGPQGQPQTPAVPAASNRGTRVSAMHAAKDRPPSAVNAGGTPERAPGYDRQRRLEMEDEKEPRDNRDHVGDRNGSDRYEDEYSSGETIAGTWTDKKSWDYVDYEGVDDEDDFTPRIMRLLREHYARERRRERGLRGLLSTPDWGLRELGSKERDAVMAFRECNDEYVRCGMRLLFPPHVRPGRATAAVTRGDAQPRGAARPCAPLNGPAARQAGNTVPSEPAREMLAQWRS